MVNIKLAVFILVSVGIVYVSRSSLRDVHTHGFYRFFAFEAILGLILVNAQAWFREPFSPLHVVSWLLLTASQSPINRQLAVWLASLTYDR